MKTSDSGHETSSADPVDYYGCSLKSGMSILYFPGLDNVR